MSVRPRRAMSLPDRVVSPVVSSPKNITPKEALLEKSEVPQIAVPEPIKKTDEDVPKITAVPGPIKKPDEELCEITKTSVVCARPIMPTGPVPLKAPFYTPFHPGSVTYSFGRSPIKFRVTPGKSSNLSFEEFKKTHLGPQRLVRRIECVDLDSDQEGEVITKSPKSKRQRTGLSHSMSISNETKGEGFGGVDKVISSTTTLEVRPSTTGHINPQPETHSVNMIVKLAATPLTNESTSISSPEMYKKIRNWLILYVNDHTGAFSEYYWVVCNQTLKEELGIPVHKDFLHIMWDQICKALAVTEARKIREGLSTSTAKVISPYRATLSPKRGSHLIKQIESSSIIQHSEVNAQQLKRKASRELDLSDESRKLKSTKLSPNHEESVNVKSEKTIREKLFLNLLSSSGVSPASRPPIQDRAPCPPPKAIHNKLLTFFSQFHYPSSIVTTGTELTIDQAYWLVSYELRNAPLQTERKPNGYWNTVTNLFNSRFGVNREKKSITETTARLMRHFGEESR